MRGLLLKDLIMLKKQMFFLLIAVVSFSMASVFGNVWSIAMVSVITSVLAVNFMIQERINGWGQYSAVLPCGRKKFVTSKYLFNFLLKLMELVIFAIDCAGAYFLHGELAESTVAMLIGSFVMGNLYTIFLLPLAFKISDNTVILIINMVIGGLIGGFIALLAENLTDIIRVMVDISSKPFFPYAVIISVCLLYVISWGISVKIYEKKDL